MGRLVRGQLQSGGQEVMVNWGKKIRVYGWVLKVKPAGFMRDWMWGVRDETRMTFFWSEPLDGCSCFAEVGNAPEKSRFPVQN